MLGLEDDHSEFLRALRGRPADRRGDARASAGSGRSAPATVAQALLRAVAGQLIIVEPRARDRARRRSAPRRRSSTGSTRAPTAADLARFSPAAARAARPRRPPRRRARPALPRDRPRGAEGRTRPRPSRARLERERGLGPWSVGVVCLEGLGRYERGLARDLGLVKLASALWGRRVEAEETDVLLAPYERVGRARERVPAGGLWRRTRRLARCGSRSSAPARSAKRCSPGCVAPDWADLIASTRREERALELHERHGVEATTSNAEAIKGADVVVLAVKPQDIETLLGEVGAPAHRRADRDLGRGRDPDRARSSATSAPTCRSSARCRTRRRPCTRASPACAPGRHAEREHIDRAGTVLRAVGDVVEVPEDVDGRDHRGVRARGRRTTRCSPRR